MCLEQLLGDVSRNSGWVGESGLTDLEVFRVELSDGVGYLDRVPDEVDAECLVPQLVSVFRLLSLVFWSLRHLLKLSFLIFDNS